MAEELIAWLRRRPFLLARIRAVRIAHRKTPLTVLRAVLTRWTSHYLALKRLLELYSTLQFIVAEDKERGDVSAFLVGVRGKKKTQKAKQMLSLVGNGLFWQNIARYIQNQYLLVVNSHRIFQYQATS